MSLAAIEPINTPAAQLQRHWVWTTERQPRRENGEIEIAEILERKGLRQGEDWFYEPWFYELRHNPDRRSFGFQPDFWLPATRRRAEVHLEVTWADRGLGRSDAGKCAASLATKRAKIKLARELHGVETVLITYADWRQIVRLYARLDLMICRALTPSAV